MLVGRYVERFHGEKLERQQHFGLVGQHQIYFRTGKPHHQVGIFEIRMRVRAFQNFILYIQIHIVQHDIQELLDLRARRRDRIFGLLHAFYTLVFFLGAARGAGAGGGGMVRLTIHCCRIPTKLLVNQYNTRPLETL